MIKEAPPTRIPADGGSGVNPGDAWKDDQRKPGSFHAFFDAENLQDC